MGDHIPTVGLRWGHNGKTCLAGLWLFLVGAWCLPAAESIEPIAQAVEASARKSTSVSAQLEEARFYPGEGWLEPTLNSQTPFDPAFFYLRRAATQAGLTNAGLVVVNPMNWQFPDMTLYVTVLDGEGNAVTGLSEESFTVWEQSSAETVPTRQTLTRFREIAGGEAGISFSLVFDVSGSMAGQPLEDAKAAAIHFLENCTEADRGNLVEFSSQNEVSMVLPSGWVLADSNRDGQTDLQEAIAGRVALDNTAIYDGTSVGIGSLSQEPTPRAVIVFTDGLSNDDAVYDINGVITKARNEGVPLYTIGVGDSIDQEVLRTMAEQTGGTYHFAPTASEMAAVYSTIAREVRSQYTIGYTTQNPDYDGTTRTITVTANNTSGTIAYVVNYRPQVTFDSVTAQLGTQSWPPGVAMPVCGMVRDLDADTPGQNLSAELFFSIAGTENYAQVPLELTPEGNDTYRFDSVIPAEAVCFPGVEWYLRVTDGIQEVVLPFDYSHAPFSVSVLDNHAPEITHTEPDDAAPGQSLTIDAQVVDKDPGDGIRAVKLFYRLHDDQQNTPYLSVMMSDFGDGLYSAVIPADKVTLAGLDYYVSAWDLNNVRTDNGTADSPYHVAMSTPWAVDFDEDGDVDGADLAVFNQRFRQGTMATNDLAVFANAFGQSMANPAITSLAFPAFENYSADLAATATPLELSNAQVVVYGEAFQSTQQVIVNLYADITGPGLCSFGVRLHYDPAGYSLVGATKNQSVWFMGNQSAALDYMDPDISQTGEVFLIGGKLDLAAPTISVTGKRVLLGTVTLAPNAGSQSSLSLSLGKPAPFANFVTMEGDVRDALSGGIEFGAVETQPDTLAGELDSLTWLTGGAFRFNVRGHPFVDCVIEVSTNLVRWTPIITNAIPAEGVLQITDPAAGGFPCRFYRAVQP
ncbi:MAG: VWA domain-containing protein [Candidatus Omnitrophica bacterium]|nr:VWA domain-containing protein [Candidatus Omnitrophota bacterium]